MAYRILSIDGGGLRGIIPLTVLQRLDAACPGWRNGIHMYAGTSTGGLIALGLARGMSPAELMKVYIERGAEIFAGARGNLFGPRYNDRNRERICRELLGETRLGDLGRHVVVTAFALDGMDDSDMKTRRWKAKIFHNLPTTNSSGDDAEKAYQVGMRTSAAPTYFSSYDGFVDGGVFANNPSMCALAQTQDDRLTTAIPVQDVSMLSLGTGFNPYYVGERTIRWGLWQWAPRFVDLMMDGVNEVADFQVRQLIRAGAYLRISKRLDRNIAMDDARKIQQMQAEGDSIDIGTATAFLSNDWSTLGLHEAEHVA